MTPGKKHKGQHKNGSGARSDAGLDGFRNGWPRKFKKSGLDVAIGKRMFKFFDKLEEGVFSFFFPGAVRD